MITTTNNISVASSQPHYNSNNSITSVICSHQFSPPKRTVHVIYSPQPFYVMYLQFTFLEEVSDYNQTTSIYIIIIITAICAVGYCHLSFTRGGVGNPIQIFEIPISNAREENAMIPLST